MIFCCVEAMTEELRRELFRNRPTHHSAYQKKLVRELGGICVTLGGICDYSTSPPMFNPHELKIVGRDCGEFSRAIILDDVYLPPEKE